MRWTFLALIAMATLGCGIDREGSLDTTTGGAGGASGSGGTSSTDGGNWPDASTGGGGSDGGGAAGASGASGAAGTTGSGGATGSEDCTNGKDDDGDKLIDCADPNCGGGFACLPAPPGGFTGPAAVYLGPDPAPTCDTSGGYPTEAKTGGTLQAPDAVCPVCGCDSSGVTCGNATVHSYGSNNCSGPEITNHAYTGCHDFGGGTANSIKLDVPTAGGSCSPTSTGSANVPPVSFSPAARVCAGETLGAGCSGGAKCGAKPAGGYSKTCVYKDGAATSCPPGAYSDLHVIDLSVKADTRACSACACTKSCDAKATASDYGSTCGGSQYATLTQDGECGQVPGQGYFGVTVTVAKACGSNGGQPTGNVTTNQLTLCCLP